MRQIRMKQIRWKTALQISGVFLFISLACAVLVEASTWTGTKKGVVEAFSLCPEEAEPAPNLGRSLLEFAAIMAYSQTKYWIERADNPKEWDYGLNLKDQLSRLYPGNWKFDANCFDYNLGHAWAGTLYYQIARTNHLGLLGSSIFTLAGAFYWEYIVEWRNAVSINDMVFTTLGGIYLGEAWFKLGQALDSLPGTRGRVLGFLNPILKLNRWLDRQGSRGHIPSLEYGGVTFDLALGARTLEHRGQNDSASGVYFEIGAQCFDEPGLGLPGKLEKTYFGSFFNEITFNMTLGTRGQDEINLESKILLFGKFHQVLDEDLIGYVYSAGMGAAFSLFRKETAAFYDSCAVKVRRGDDLELDKPREFRDKVAAVHILGPVFDEMLYTGGGRFRLRLDAFLDFAMVNAYALNQYSHTNDIQGIRNTLLYYGYYYAWGGTVSASLTWEYRGLAWGTRWRYQTYRSLNNSERFPSDVTQDFPVRDGRWTGLLSLKWIIPGTWLGLTASVEWVGRDGKIEATYVDSLELRTVFGLIYGF